MKENTPQTPEEAREMALKSFDELMSKMFDNIQRDLKAGIKASKALSATGKICGEPEDEENGKYFAVMLEQLGIAVGKINILYKERIGKTEITEEEWEKLDRATEE